MKDSNHYLVFAIFLLAIIISGCSMPDRSQSIIDLKQEDPVSVFDFFSEILLVVPETHPDFIISTISHIEYHKEQYFLFDIKSQQVFCVDKEGKFKFKISSQGHGKGEYVYISSMAIDRFNDEILLLESSMQRIQVYSISGLHLHSYAIESESMIAMNRVYALNASTLIISTIAHDYLVFFCRDTERIIHTDYPYPLSGGIHPFTPFVNMYQLNGKTYVLPPLSADILDVTDVAPSLHFTYDFGVNNNSAKQIETLIDEISRRGFSESFIYHHEGVGRGKILHSHIVKVAETSRYYIAVVEVFSDWRNIIIDKKEDKYYVFRSFKEGVSLLYLNIADNMAMGSAMDLDRVAPEIRQRVVSRFNKSLINEQDMNRLDNWDEMTDNPYFVVYKFKE